MRALKKLPAWFFATKVGNEPVREWLMALDAADRKNIGQDIMNVEFGWPVGLPLSRSLGDGLYEVRSSLKSNKIARVIFFVHNRKMILLHGFIKKSQKTPKIDLDLATKRMNEVKRNG